jgi:rod shape-determining protein MreC
VFRWNAFFTSHWRYLCYFALLILAWWLVPVGLRLGVRSVLQELQAPLWYGADGVHQVRNYWHLRSQTKEELMRTIVILSRQVAHQNLVEKIPVPDENGEIFPKDTLGGFKTLFTRILRRDAKSWWQEVVISGGKNRDIKENMALVNGRGLIGKTQRIFSYHTQGILATDPRFRIVVHAKGDTRPIIFQGAFQENFHRPIGHITHVPKDLCASKDHPLLLITSSLSGVYPEGIPVGVVHSLKGSSDGVTQEGIVFLNPDLLNVREAVILIPPPLKGEVNESTF